MEVEKERDNEQTNAEELKEVIQWAEDILQSDNPQTIFSYIKIFTDSIENQRAVRILRQGGHDVRKEGKDFDTTHAYFRPFEKLMLNDDILNARKLDKPINVSNATSPVLTKIWRADRTVNAIEHIGKDVPLPEYLENVKKGGFNEFEYDPTNHIANYIYPMGLSLVWNGNHSIYAGTVKSEGEFEAIRVTDISNQYGKLRFDGTYLINEITGEKEKVYFELGVVFEIGRLLLDYPEIFPSDFETE